MMSRYLPNLTAEELIRYVGTLPQLTPLETALARKLSDYVYAGAPELVPQVLDNPVQLSLLYEQIEEEKLHDARG